MRPALTATVVIIVVAVFVVALAAADQAPKSSRRAATGKLADLPVGAPPRLAVYGPRSVRLPGGEVIPTGVDGIQRASRTAGGWLVASASALRVLRDDGTVAVDVSPMERFALSTDRSRIAVQSWTLSGRQVEVVELPSGRKTASIPLPTEPYGGTEVLDWAGSLVLLRTFTHPYVPKGGYGVPVVTVWDPATGGYRPSPSVETNIVAPAAQPGQVLAMWPPDCLTRLDLAAGFAVTARSCGLYSRIGLPSPYVSPGGTRLVLAPESHRPSPALEVIEVDAALAGLPARGTVTLPTDVWMRRLWWEDVDTLLLDVERSGEDTANWERVLTLVRCRVDGSPCELAPAPHVEGADPVGVMDR